MEIFAYDYEKNKVMTGVDSSEVNRIDILIVSGDEILEIAKNDGTIVSVDAGADSRVTDYYDGKYVIRQEELSAWMTRKHSYDNSWESEAPKPPETADDPWFKCGECGRELTSDMFKYCPWCGKEVKWDG